MQYFWLLSMKPEFDIAIEEKLKLFLLETSDHPLDLQEVFGNDNPVHVEIGSGRGEFIAEMARILPKVNFLGFELKWKRFPPMLKRLDESMRVNVRLAAEYVDKSIGEKIREGTVEKVYIIHPDPWPKRKHHKHRIIQQPFIDALHLLLKPDGEVYLSTDHRDYALWIQKEFAKRDDFTVVEDFVKPPVVTHFEDMKRREGFEPISMTYRKKEISHDQSPETERNL